MQYCSVHDVCIHLGQDKCNRLIIWCCKKSAVTIPHLEALLYLRYHAQKKINFLSVDIYHVYRTSRSIWF